MTRDERSRIDLVSGLRGMAVIVVATALITAAAWVLALVFTTVIAAVA